METQLEKVVECRMVIVIISRVRRIMSWSSVQRNTRSKLVYRIKIIIDFLQNRK
jgi:hypothetical protein